MTDGPDVAQLDANLIALGYASAADLTVSDTFTDATFYAVERWQAALGLPVTGTVAAGQVAYAPGPLRVTTVTPTLGVPAQPGAAVLTATSPDPVVDAALPVAQEYLVATGRPGQRDPAGRHDRPERRGGVGVPGGDRRGWRPLRRLVFGAVAGGSPSGGGSGGAGDLAARAQRSR